MALNYAALRATAKRLIGNNGAACKLRNPIGDPVYDVPSNSYIQNYEDYEGYCVLSSYADELVNGTVIQTGDRKATAVLPAEPMPGLSRLVILDRAGNPKDDYLVVNSAPVSPSADTAILHKIQCRK
jgi:hypothetical protein